MADEPIPSAEPEISAPPPAEPPRPSRPDPGVIDGEATEIRNETAAPEVPATGAPPRAASAVAAAGFGGAILGAALALFAAWLIDPRAGALDDARARLVALDKTVETQAAATAALEKRIAGLEAGAGDAAKSAALDALGRRLGALEATNGDVKSALAEARADAAKALAAAEAPPPPAVSAAPAAANDLEPRLAKLESELAGADARLDKLSALDDRLGKLEGASAAEKSDARVAPVKGGSDAAAAIAVLALSLDQRLAAGAPFAPELAALSQLGVGADALAPLKPFAESGAPTPAALAADWGKVEAKVAAAAAPADRSGWDRMVDHMRALVRVRRVGEAAGSAESELPVAQIGAALESGDVAAALEAFAKLPEAARAAGHAWAVSAQARDAAVRAATALRAEAIGRMATAKD